MKDSSFPLISIVILNFNQLKVTCEFLDSTKVLKYPNFEIIFVDNNSKENPTDYVKQNYPDVKLIVNERNLGFTGGNNVGIAAAKGDYIFVVNNDTEVTPNLLENLLEPFLKDPKIGMVSPKIKFFQQPNVIQYAGYNAINPLTGRNSAVGNKEEDNGQHDMPGYTCYAHGAAMLVKKEVIDKVGAFYDDFFIYYEELDWSARAKRAGYEIYYQPSAVILHKESITMGKESQLKAYYHNRNRILFMRRNTTNAQFFVFSMFYAFFTVPKFTLKYMFQRRMNYLALFYKGIIWNFRNNKNK